MTSFQKEINEHQAIFNQLGDLEEEVIAAAQLMIDSLKSGGKIILMGNGGSAADAQHIAAEFVGRYLLDRKGLPAIALTTDTSTITSIANDYGFKHLFSRQLEAIAKKEDVVVGISTSGNSFNVLEAFKYAKTNGLKTIGLLGNKGGEIKSLSNISVIIPSDHTPRIQEAHIFIGHVWCGMVETELAKLN